MPEDADAELPIGILERLDHAVRAARRDLQRRGHLADALVVVGRHLDRRVPEDRRRGRFRQRTHGVRGEHTRRALMPTVPGSLAEILDEVTAEGDVQQLHTPADAEGRQFRGERGVEHQTLEAVACPGELVDAVGPRVCLIGVEAGV